MKVTTKLTNNKDAVLNELANKTKKALEECGLLAEGYAKLNCPVDTGNLRNSISHKVAESDMHVGTNVEYAPYVELGTGSFYPGGSAIRGRMATPYLKPAIDENRATYQQVIYDNLKS